MLLAVTATSNALEFSKATPDAVPSAGFKWLQWQLTVMTHHMLQWKQQHSSMTLVLKSKLAFAQQHDERV